MGIEDVRCGSGCGASSSNFRLSQLKPGFPHTFPQIITLTPHFMYVPLPASKPRKMPLIAAFLVLRAAFLALHETGHALSLQNPVTAYG
jgi:hypothetical protein